MVQNGLKIPACTTRVFKYSEVGIVGSLIFIKMQWRP